MANYYFPQLASGAIAQYPIRKTRVARTITNVMPDGSVILQPDADGSRMIWQLGYSALSSQDMGALAGLFNACQGRVRAFTFIDPAENMLSSSSILQGAAWQNAGLIKLTADSPDPIGGTNGYIAVNTAQLNQEIAQTVNVPANYHYCFSMYVRSDEAATITLVRRGPATEQSDVVEIGPDWSRVVSGGALSDPGATFTVAISLAPGQQVSLYGPQLEAQLSPSRYRPTQNIGGVYPNAHWGIDELPVQAIGPNLFSTSFSIEATL